MHDNYFTLAALAREWDRRLRDATFRDAFSISRGEITLAFQTESDAFSIRVGTMRPLLYAFAHEGIARPRRNAVAFFESAHGVRVTGCRVADLDRHVFIELADGRRIQIMLFGPRANVLLVGRDGRIEESFRLAAQVVGQEAPSVQPASMPASPDALARAMDASSGNVSRRLRRALPLIDDDIAREIIRRASSDDVDALFKAWEEVRDELQAPRPAVVDDDGNTRLTLLSETAAQHASTFPTVNEAVSTYVRRRLGRAAFENRFEPLWRAVERMAETAAGRVESMMRELSRPSRADEYERFGHLLMATPEIDVAGRDVLRVPDLFGDAGTVDIPVDGRLSVIENAEKYYERARRVRASRQSAEARFEAAATESDAWQALREELSAVRDLAALEAFRKRHVAALESLRTPGAGKQAEALPYRSLNVDGFEVLIGRSATLNDRLTFGIARKHDLWLHARGVAGSHVIVRVERGKSVPRPTLERIASIAAWHSRARTSGLAPVIVTERKYVRKPRGAQPGAVLVERERVLTVEPRPA